MADPTPGPWVVHVEPDHSIHRTPSTYICRSDEPWPDGQLARVNTADEFGSQIANARLIAAAPELLAVAERMLTFAQSGAAFSYPLGSLQELEAAIAKARGQ